MDDHMMAQADEMEGTGFGADLGLTKPEPADLDPYRHLPADLEPSNMRVVESDFREIGPLEAVGALYESLARAQGEFATIAKNRTAKITPREGRGAPYSFDFADLDAVLAATRPHLNREGIVVLQPPAQVEPGIIRLRTFLAKGLAKLEATTTFAYDGDIKAMGGTITYHRRYQYNGLLCLSADADADDGPSVGDGERAGTSGPREPAARQRSEIPPPPNRAPERPPAARAQHSETRTVRPPTDAQKSEINEQFRRLKWAPAMLQTVCRSVVGHTTAELTDESAEVFIRHLKAQKQGSQ